MSFSTLSGYNLPQRERMPEYVAPVAPPAYQPGFMDKFAGALGEGVGSSIQQQIADRLEASALERALGSVNPNASALEQQLQLARGGVGPQQRENVSKILKPGQDARAKQAEQEFELQKIQQQHENRKALETHKQGAKPKKGERTPEEQAHVEGVFGRIEDIVNSGNIGVANPILSASGPLWRLISKDYRTAEAELKPLNLEIFSTARKLENTGHLRKEETAAVQNLLIQPNDTVDQMQAKLRGLRKIFKIPEREAQGRQQNFQVGQQLEQLPAAASPGTIATDDKTGARLIFNGTDWQRMQ